MSARASHYLFEAFYFLPVFLERWAVADYCNFIIVGRLRRGNPSLDATYGHRNLFFPQIGADAQRGFYIGLLYVELFQPAQPVRHIAPAVPSPMVIVPVAPESSGAAWSCKVPEVETLQAPSMVAR